MIIKFGSLFYEKTGKEARECADFEDIDREAQRVHKRKLEYKKFDSDFVPARGNVFNVNRFSENINQEFDKQIKRMHAICRRT